MTIFDDMSPRRFHAAVTALSDPCRCGHLRGGHRIPVVGPYRGRCLSLSCGCDHFEAARRSEARWMRLWRLVADRCVPARALAWGELTGEWWPTSWAEHVRSEREDEVWRSAW